jgi:hypothetical protein
MSSLRRHEGYLLIDHSVSPGMTPGADPTLVGPGRVFESATITCSHCRAVIVLNPDRSRPRHYCAKCDHYVCDKPACVLVCDPMEAQYDRFLKQAIILGDPGARR